MFKGNKILSYFKGDRVIWMVIFVLTIISLLAVYSSTGMLAYKYQGGNTGYYILKHFMLLMVGLVTIYITHLIPYKFYAGFSHILLVVAIPLLLITLLMGANLNEASRWLKIPGTGLTFQTSDIAKIALILYLSKVLSTKQEKLEDFKTVLWSLFGPIGLVCALILPANFSTAAMLFLVSMVLLFIGRVKISHILAVCGLAAVVGGMFIVIKIAFGDPGRALTWKSRIENFVSGESEGNYQVEQSKIAIATGGIIGKGPGNSDQRNYLPHPYSDFIYAIIIEEYGLLGGIVILFLYMYLLYRAGVIVRKSMYAFPAFLAVGLSFLLVLQALINMAVAVNLMPVTGQTLPLVSMGGTSLIFTSFSLGIILSISRSVKEYEEKFDTPNVA